MTFAKATRVPIERTIGEIQKTLTKAGANKFGYMTHDNKAVVAFCFKNVGIKMAIKLPPQPSSNSTQASIKTYEQRHRQVYRQFLLCIKAKIEGVMCGVETLEQAFLPYIVLKDGTTVGQKAIPAIEQFNSSPASLLLGL